MEVVLLVLIIMIFFTLLLTLITRRLFSCTIFCKDNEENTGIFLESSVADETKYNKCSCLMLGCICSQRNVKSIIYLPDSQQIHYGACIQEGDLQTLVINKTCPICYDNFLDEQDIVRLKCHHGYHNSCIRKWIRRGIHTTCPLCVRQINIDLFSFDDSVYNTPQAGIYNFGGYFNA